jgi:hypothetical protein
MGDGVLDLGMLCERDPGLYFAGIGIEDIAEPTGGPLDGLAADEMADLTHGSLSSGFLQGPRRNLGALAPICGDFRSFLPAGHGLRRVLAGRFSFTIG